MAVVSIIIVCLLSVVLIGMGVLAYFFFKTKRPLIGKATIPPQVQNSQIMEMLGEANAQVDELKKKLQEITKEKELKVNVGDEIKRRLIQEKVKIIKENHLLFLKSKELYDIIGHDSSNYGKLIAIVLGKDGERAWIYFKNKEIVDLIGGKPLAEIVKSIDKKRKIIFIQYDQNKKLIPKQYEEI